MGWPNRRLCPLQPETHAHLAVHGRRGRQVLPGHSVVAGATVEPAEAEVAVGDEGAHAEGGRPRQRLTVGDLGFLGSWRGGCRGDLASSRHAHASVPR
jgi:hypothetical protein